MIPYPLPPGEVADTIEVAVDPEALFNLRLPLTERVAPLDRISSALAEPVGSRSNSPEDVME